MLSTSFRFLKGSENYFAAPAKSYRTKPPPPPRGRRAGVGGKAREPRRGVLPSQPSPTRGEGKDPQPSLLVGEGWGGGTARRYLHKSLERFAVGNLQRPAEIIADLGGRIDAEAFENGGKHIADGGAVTLNVQAIFAGGAEDLATLDSAAA